MFVSQIMKRDCCAVMHTDLIEVAAKKMEEKHAGTALVFEEGQVRGIVTEKEITEALKAGANVLGGEPSLDDDGNRCCYFSDVKIELLLGDQRPGQMAERKAA